MDSSLSFFAIIALSIIPILVYRKFNYPKIEHIKYSVSEHSEYNIESSARVYKYNATYNHFLDLEEEYRESLFGNNIKKKYVDEALKKYLENNTIHQKRLVIKMIDWIADINISTNVNPNTLVIEIFNNSMKRFFLLKE